jgi:hypothetical protein
MKFIQEETGAHDGNAGTTAISMDFTNCLSVSIFYLGMNSLNQ